MLTISHTTRTQGPRLPYEAIARDILGARYALSLVFVGNHKSRALNKIYRQKTYTPNVLSFPLSETEGEVFINPHVAQKEAPKFGMSTTGFIGFLFIHALLHLKGYDHGDTMERAETRYLKKYGLK